MKKIHVYHVIDDQQVKFIPNPVIILDTTNKNL